MLARIITACALLHLFNTREQVCGRQCWLKRVGGAKDLVPHGTGPTVPWTSGALAKDYDRSLGGWRGRPCGSFVSRSSGMMSGLHPVEWSNGPS